MKKLTQICSYGENAWQRPAGLYSRRTSDPLALDKFQLIQGTAPSYNNLCDLDRLLQTITHIAAAFEVNLVVEASEVPFIAVGAKHGNPCGAAVGTPLVAIQKMVTGDTRAIFGGLVIMNFTLNEEGVETLLTHGQSSVGSRRLLDGVIVPEITHDALKMLTRKGDKCRVFVNPALAELGVNSLDRQLRTRYVRGGFLFQPNYTFVLDLNDPSIEKIGRPLEPEEEGALLIAWGVGSTSNSNTVTLVNNHRLIGNGVGQQDRVGAAELALRRAEDAGHEEEIEGAVAYSDSFFPFPDAPRALGMAGIQAILASSGSIKDEAAKEACTALGVSLLLIPDKMGRGFFGH